MAYACLYAYALHERGAVYLLHSVHSVCSCVVTPSSSCSPPLKKKGNPTTRRISTTMDPAALTATWLCSASQRTHRSVSTFCIRFHVSFIVCVCVCVCVWGGGGGGVGVSQSEGVCVWGCRY